MAAEQTISLHDAGCRLALTHHTREKVAAGKLLSLLKSGQIEAGFQFSGPAILWIAIPVKFWTTVTNDKFRVIRNTKKPGSGAFKVRIGKFADEVVAQVHGRIESLGLAALNEWKDVIKATTGAYEVVITERAWINYLNENNLNKSNSEVGPGRGRREKKGWREIAIVIGAYIIKHYKSSNENIKTREAGEIIHKIADAENIFDAPAGPTIGDALGKMYEKAKTISIN